MIRILYILYQWLVYIPLLVFITVFICLGLILSTIIFQPKKGGYLSLIAWGRILCYASFSLVTVHGRENIRKGKSYVFVANHQGAFDIFVIYGFLHKDFRWIMKKELRKIPLVGGVCEMLGHIFIDRSNLHSIKESLDKAKKSLQGGLSVVVFPEGSRTHTGQLGPFKRGAYQLAVDLEIPIVPITIDGSFAILSRDSMLMRPSHLTMTIHPPVQTVGKTHADISELIQQTRNTIVSALVKEEAGSQSAK